MAYELLGTPEATAGMRPSSDTNACRRHRSPVRRVTVASDPTNATGGLITRRSERSGTLGIARCSVKRPDAGGGALQFPPGDREVAKSRSREAGREEEIEVRGQRSEVRAQR